MPKTLILGMNNPHRDGDPLSPTETAGRRLFKMSGMTRDEYEASFHRRNLIDQREWDQTTAREAGRKFKTRAKKIVVLGKAVAAAIGVDTFFWQEQSFGKANLIVVPHPSGLCRHYNEAIWREKLRLTLRMMIKK